MIDLLYIAGTLLFFALMLWYVSACEKTGPHERSCRPAIMSLESVIALACAVLVLVYLAYTLVRPEKF